MKINGDLYGLVVCGGKSSRMGTDKGSLVYHEKPQRHHVYDLLDPLCSKVFFSCNRNQTDFLTDSNMLTDLPEFENIGPMAALLTAFSHFPNQDFLVSGCDYPFLKQKDLKNFLNQIEGRPVAAAFFNKHHKYEPLLAWYSREAAPLLLACFAEKSYSLQNFLKDVDAVKFQPIDEIVMHSADTPEDYLNAKKSLKR